MILISGEQRRHLRRVQERISFAQEFQFEIVMLAPDEQIAIDALIDKVFVTDSIEKKEQS